MRVAKKKVSKYVGVCKSTVHEQAHIWFSRKNHQPKVCPKCKGKFIMLSHYYDKDLDARDKIVLEFERLAKNKFRY